jgi:phosphoribosylpyrophosphate synthetase
MDLYLDCEWFIGGEIFLIGWSRNTKVFGQLYDDTLTEERFQDLLDETDGRIYFYGPDIGIIEKYFDIDIRSNYHCVNLLKVFKDNLPGMENYKLATIEKHYHIKRNRNEYKANIFSIFQDWRKPQVRSLVLQYNREDVINLARLKNIIFAQFDIEDEYLLQVKLAGTIEVTKNYACKLPCDVFKGKGIITGNLSANRSDAENGLLNASKILWQAKFNLDRFCLAKMIVILSNLIEESFDIITCVNNRENDFHIARALAVGIGNKLKIPFKEVLSENNTKAEKNIQGKRILIIDDVIYKGTTMKKVIETCSVKKPTKIYFLAFGKSERYAY